MHTITLSSFYLPISYNHNLSPLFPCKELCYTQDTSIYFGNVRLLSKPRSAGGDDDTASISPGASKPRVILLHTGNLKLKRPDHHAKEKNKAILAQSIKKKRILFCNKLTNFDCPLPCRSTIARLDQRIILPTYTQQLPNSPTTQRNATDHHRVLEKRKTMTWQRLDEFDGEFHN